MTDEVMIECLEDIIDSIKSGDREQAECDLMDLYDEISENYDDIEDNEINEEDDFSEENE